MPTHATYSSAMLCADTAAPATAYPAGLMRTHTTETGVRSSGRHLMSGRTTSIDRMYAEVNESATAKTPFHAYEPGCGSN